MITFEGRRPSARVDGARIEQHLGQGLVLSELLDPTLANKVGPRVADLGDVSRRSLHQSCSEGRAHSHKIYIVL